MHFRVDEAKPFLQLEAFKRSGLWGKAGFGLEVGDVLNDGGAFRQADAVVEFQNGNVTFRVDCREIAAVGNESTFLDIDLDKFGGDTGFAQGDMR